MEFEPPPEWVDDPPSQDIADILNATDADRCPHGEMDICVLKCGVFFGWFSRGGDGRGGDEPPCWKPFPLADRLTCVGGVVL